MYYSGFDMLDSSQQNHSLGIFSPMFVCTFAESIVSSCRRLPDDAVTWWGRAGACPSPLTNRYFPTYVITLTQDSLDREFRRSEAVRKSNSSIE
jgi:hypothetical protein